jgi:hypothetical protein
MDGITRHCPACGEERRFERPPCHDGHGADCPEVSCVHCGHALLIAPVPEPAEFAESIGASPGSDPTAGTDRSDHADDARTARSRAA